VIGLRVEHLDGVPVAHLPTDVDAANATRLRTELNAFVGNEALDIVLVLDETRFLDSAGIDMLFRLSRRLSDRRARVRIVIPAGSPLRRLTQIVGLERAVPFYETVADAVAAAGSLPADQDEDQAGEPGQPPTGGGGCHSRA
jgi:anti-anti-sigma factor